MGGGGRKFSGLEAGLDSQWLTVKSGLPRLPRVAVVAGRRLLPFAWPLIEARGPGARIRAVEHRGVVGAAMVLLFGAEFASEWTRLPDGDREVARDWQAARHAIRSRGDPG